MKSVAFANPQWPQPKSNAALSAYFARLPAAYFIDICYNYNTFPTACQDKIAKPSPTADRADKTDKYGSCT